MGAVTVGADIADRIVARAGFGKVSAVVVRFAVSMLPLIVAWATLYGLFERWHNKRLRQQGFVCNLCSAVIDLRLGQTFVMTGVCPHCGQRVYDD